MARVLVVGGGGREHALAWKLAQSEQVDQVFVAPGNAGTAREPKTENILIQADQLRSLEIFAANGAIDLVVIGPEQPLVMGLSDKLKEAGVACFGPNQYCAQLEGSKAFMKDFLVKNNIPTARHQSFTELKPAQAFAAQLGAPVVIKTDGLAAGKGVIIAQSIAEANEALTSMLSGERFGQAGQRVIVEEFLGGEEASFIAMVDGEHIVPMATSQDHKTRDEGDVGPNTGGMGAYSPAPIISDAVHEQVMEKVMRPTVNALKQAGHPFVGFLYAGLMIDAQGKAKVLEFNVRMGDPETQPIMYRLQSDLYQHMIDASQGNLNANSFKWNPDPALGVVLAAKGYPESYKKGEAIAGLEQAAKHEGKIFHAGTRLENGNVVSNGGRVLCAVSSGKSIAEAQKKAYRIADDICWPSIYFRRDIGHRAIKA